jgi:uncharacterized membrane protein YbhN (UPF0104 family)
MHLTIELDLPRGAQPAAALVVAGTATLPVLPPEPASVAGTRLPRLDRGLTRRGAFALIAALVAVAVVASGRIDLVSPGDLISMARSAAVDAAHLRWQFTAVVVALAAAHYLATAVVTRASVDLELPLREVLLVQLAAASANRLTPSGVGGSAVTAHYFVRRGLPRASAVGAVVVMQALRSLANLAVLVALVVIGPLVGLGGAPAEVAMVSSKLSHLLAPLGSRWTWVGAGVVVAAALLLRRFVAARVAGTAKRFWAPAIRLTHDRRSLLTVLGAGAATTLIMAFAFVASTAMVPGAHAHASTGAILVGFLLGSAAGGAVPTPAGIGSTDTALVAVLLMSGVPTALAVQVVVIHRVITFWIPPALGLIAARRLRASGAL